MAKKIVLLSFCIAIGCIVAASIWSTPVNAQETGEAAAADAVFIDFKHLALLVIESVVFSIVGVIVLMVGYKIFDMVTPFDLNHQIAEDNNTAAGIAVAGVIIALGLIVAAAVG
jgi:hypothetical protein